MQGDSIQNHDEVSGELERVVNLGLSHLIGRSVFGNISRTPNPFTKGQKFATGRRSGGWQGVVSQTLLS